MERMRRAATTPIPVRPISIPKSTPAEQSADQLAELLAAPIHAEPTAESPFLPGEEPAPRATSAEIIKEVSLKHHVSVEEIVSQIRSAWVVAARFEAMYRIREERHLSWAQIGRLFGRDHTSVLHGWRKHKASLDPAIAPGELTS